MVRDGQGPGAASLASSGRRGPRRAAAFLYLLYTRPAKLYPVFIPVSLICLACAATASGCRARRSFREKKRGSRLPRRLRGHGRPGGGPAAVLRLAETRRARMIGFYWLAGALAAFLFAYLLVALFKPEKF
ncbi:potassium-transporting ATPase subunit F [Bordetella genomosp. 2]|uniref:Potassium-transporting ATPase subunit F n=1 Tax=Bordetella genomosp. 2 TaxID=1983456 RepID=A0A261VKP1_9BORD|nr:potassium-transporting ATPase subunit F [Bordetella genomosp. 2]